MSCHVHHLRHVAVWLDKHCFMLRRCTGCRRFEVGFVYTKDEPFPGSTNTSIDEVPADKLGELRTFVSRIPRDTKEPEGVLTFPM